MPVLTLRPNSDVSINIDFPSGTHYDRVNDESDSTYVYQNQTSVYKQDIYGLPNHTTEAGVINSVTLYFRYKPTTISSSKGYIKGFIVTNGSKYYTSLYYGTFTFFTTKSKTWTTNPSTGNAWTWDEIDNLQAGISVKKDGSGYIQCSEVWVEVDYTPITREEREVEFGVSAPDTRRVEFGVGLPDTRRAKFGVSTLKENQRSVSFGVKQYQKYSPVLVKINGTDARDIVRVITITDNRFNEIDECVIETKSLEELPSYINTDAINEVEIWYSNADLLFAGYFYPPDKTPKHNVLNNIYTFKALSWLDKFKRIRVTKTFDGYTASQIVRALVEEYAPDFSTEYIDNNTTTLHLTFDRQTLYDCIKTVASLVQWNFWVDNNKAVHFVDLVNQSHSGVTIDDEHFIAAEGFTKYDYSQLFNKVVVKGGQALSELQYKDWYGDGSTTRFKVSYIEFENLLVKKNGTALAGGFYGKDDFSTKEYLLDVDTKEIIFETAPSSSDHIEVWYQFIYTPVYTYEDQESIEKWGILEAEPITQPSVTDVSTLKYIGQVFVDTHKDPKVVGKIVVRDTQLSKMIYAGDYIDVDLSRYYTGTIQIDKIIHTITPTKHELQIIQRPQRDLYRTLADVFDKLESYDLRLKQMEGSQVLQTTKSVTDTLTLSDSVSIETPSLPYYIEDFDENIGLVEVEATSEQLNN